MKPGLGRATPKWIVKSKTQCPDSDLQSTDLDRYLDIVSRLWKEMYRSILIPRERFNL